NINPNQSQAEFIRSLGVAKGIYLDYLRKVDPAKAEEIEKRGDPVIGQDGVITYDDRGREALGGGTGGGNGGGGPVQGPDGPGFWQQFGAGVGDLVEGAGDTVGIVTNPVGQAWYAALGIDDTYDTGQIL